MQLLSALFRNVYQIYVSDINGDRMHVILIGEPLEEVDCFKYLGSQVATDGGCERDVVHRMNEEYRSWGALKSVLSNRGLGIKAKKCLYEE